MKKLLTPICFTAIFSFVLMGSVQAQQEEELKKAEVFFEKQDYHNAAILFEDLLFKNYDHPNTTLKAGICNLFLSKADKGLELIKRAKTAENAVDPNYNFWLGRAYHLNMKMDSALMGYRKYIAVSSRTDEFRKGVEDLIAQIHRTDIHFLTAEESPFSVNNAGENVNSIYTEHSPIATDDGNLLIFTSRRPLFADEKQEPDGEYSEKLFYTIKQQDGSWGRAIPLFPSRSAKSRFSSIQLIANGSKLLLYNHEEGGSVWAAEREGDSFKEPVKASELNLPAKFFSMDGCLNKNMDRIAFISNTLFDGAFDLSISERKTESKWGKPVKLSRYHNSPEDEIAPFWSEDGTSLIFSSKGLLGLGGYDLYKTKYDEYTKTFTQPVNLGYPINTSGNETHYYETNGAEKISYIASARPGGFGETDIYTIKYNPQLTQGK